MAKKVENFEYDFGKWIGDTPEAKAARKKAYKKAERTRRAGKVMRFAAANIDKNPVFAMNLAKIAGKKVGLKKYFKRKRRNYFKAKKQAAFFSRIVRRVSFSPFRRRRPGFRSYRRRRW